MKYQDIPFYWKVISSSRAVKILFLSFTCEDIGVAVVTNMISQLQESFPLRHVAGSHVSPRGHVISSISYYIISSVMHAFWLVLTYELLEDRRIDDVIIYYIKQIDSKLPCVCSVLDHRGRQNVVRTSVTHSAAPHTWPMCHIFGSYHILTSSATYYWADAWQLGIYLLNRT